jgi:O-methyltransferase
MTLLNDQKIVTMLRHALKNPTGLIGEVGVFNGGFTGILSDNFLDTKIYAYDTFEGMPESCWVKDEHHYVGEFKPELDVVRILNNRKNVVVRKGIFPDSIQDETGFWMVHLDVDFYLSTLNSLKVLKDRMAKGGAIFLDDWDWPNCPGVRKAVEELGFTATQTVEHQAVINF